MKFSAGRILIYKINFKISTGSQVKPLYKYGYWVHDPKTNDMKNHWEHRDGDVVHGSYSLMQPDGHMRVVDYTVDRHNGFNAHVKYIYEGGHGSGNAAKTAAIGSAEGFGGEFNSHLEDVSGPGQALIGGGVNGRSHAKQSLSKLYKKLRSEKSEGQPGDRYKKPYLHSDDRAAKSANGGGHAKKQRLQSTAADYSAEHYNNHRANTRFEQLSKFPSSVQGGGGGNNPFGYPGDELHGANRASDDFARKYSSTSGPSGGPSSKEKSFYYTGIQHQNGAEQGLLHRRHDVTSAASTEHHNHLQGGGTVSRIQRRSHKDDDQSRQQYDDEDDDRVSGELYNPKMFAKMQRQQLKEYSFEDSQPYPFDVPEDDLPSSLISAKHYRKRRLT